MIPLLRLQCSVAQFRISRASRASPSIILTGLARQRFASLNGFVDFERFLRYPPPSFGHFRNVKYEKDTNLSDELAKRTQKNHNEGILGPNLFIQALQFGRIGRCGK